MKFKELDGCPVPADIFPLMSVVGRKAHATLQSCYRGQDPEAQPILRKFGKKNQAQLYQMFLNGTGNPANKPGQSTHECRNDGVAYAGPVGMPLKSWQVGQDWDIPHVAAVVAEYRRQGVEATVTYPHSSRERQHVNIRKAPKFKVFVNLKRGQRSPRVYSLRKNLAFVMDPEARKPYLPSSKRIGGGSSLYFDDMMYHALREFQRDHGLKDTGVYDYRTAKQMAASVRFAKRRKK
jgi:murein L,D-transpeptidase YcbB/YkuD